MANPAVEKLKNLGLKHGEKAVMALTATLCLVFMVVAIIKPTISITPDQVNKAASDADSNLKKRQDRADILTRLEAENIKDTSFEAIVDGQANNVLVADQFRPGRAWVTPEPGAGLIRDQPKLVVPSELIAYAGRGGTDLYDLDEKGEKIAEALKAGEVKKGFNNPRKKRGAPGGAGGGSGMSFGGGMGGMPGAGGAAGAGSAREKEETKRKEAEEKTKLARKLAGSVDTAKESAKEKERTAAGGAADASTANTNYTSSTKGLRWVSVTGVLDNRKLKENYLAALKDPAFAYPNYSKIELERQVKTDKGDWSRWSKLDTDKNYVVIDNLVEVDPDELTPDNVRLEALVDPLPFLKAGYWEKVHVAKLVPKELREIQSNPTAGGMMGGPGMMGSGGGGGMMMGAGGGMPGGGARSGGGSSMMAMGGGRGGEDMAGMMSGRGGGRSGMMGGASGGGGGMPGMMGLSGAGGGGGGGGGAMYGGGSADAPATVEDTSFAKSEEEEVMVRSLDFTVVPDVIYRYRARLVVFNPNYNRDDTSPGTDTSSDQLAGDWSEPTDEVTVPADITAYAIRKDEGTKRDEVWYQITRFNPEDGVTVVKSYAAGPGSMIGDFSTAAVPVSDGSGAKSKPIDFVARQVVIDSMGGTAAIPKSLGIAGKLSVPALTLVMRADGSVVVRNQAKDQDDEVRREMADTYTRSVKESSKKREPGMGGAGGMGGMMGGMMGGAGGGMPGMGGGGMRGGGPR